MRFVNSQAYFDDRNDKKRLLGDRFIFYWLMGFDIEITMIRLSFDFGKNDG
jgi:hypothetical protein